MKDFDGVRRAAVMHDLLAFLLRRPADLLPFEEVRERLRLRGVVDRGVQEVPLARITGTVQRERDFNRAFLPRDEKLRGRWQDLEDLAADGRGFAPVELYRVGDVDFVVDGHHRVSVARAKGLGSIEARVKEFRTAVPLSADASIEDVILKEGLAGHVHTLRERYGPDVAVSWAVRHFELSLSRGRGPIARLRAWWRTWRRPPPG